MSKQYDVLEETQRVYGRVVGEFKSLRSIARAAKIGGKDRVAHLLVIAYRNGDLSFLSKALDILEEEKS